MSRAPVGLTTSIRYRVSSVRRFYAGDGFFAVVKIERRVSGEGVLLYRVQPITWKADKLLAQRECARLNGAAALAAEAERLAAIAERE